MPSPRTLLFICTGNICRSAFAEAYAREKWGGLGLEISSLGLKAVVDGRSPSLAREVARAYGLDLEPHRGRQFEDEWALLADGILVMNERQREMVIERIGETRQRPIHLLSDFCPGPMKVPRIPDPYGADLWGYESCFALVAACVDEYFRLNFGAQK